MPPSDHVLLRGEVFALDIQQVRTHIRWKYIEFVVSNHSSLKNCAELQFACLWHTNMHTNDAYMLYMVSETQKGGNMGEHYMTIWQYKLQSSPGITRDHPSQLPFFEAASPITGPNTKPRPPEICRNISATASGCGSFSPHVSRNSLRHQKTGGFQHGITGYHGLSWSPGIEMWLSIMVYHGL